MMVWVVEEYREVREIREVREGKKHQRLPWGRLASFAQEEVREHQWVTKK